MVTIICVNRSQAYAVPTASFCGCTFFGSGCFHLCHGRSLDQEGGNTGKGRKDEPGENRRVNGINGHVVRGGCSVGSFQEDATESAKQAGDSSPGPYASASL